MIRTQQTAAAIVGAALGLAFFGGGSLPNHSHQAFKTRLDSLWIDLSDQSPDALNWNGGVAFSAQRYMDQNSNLRVFVFAHKFDLAYSGHPMSSRGAFNRAIGRLLNKPTPGMNALDTHTELALHEIATDEFGLDREATIVTDGGVEQQSAKVIGGIRADVQRLATDQHFVRLTVLGVLQQHRKQWEEWLTPLGSRAKVYGRNDFKEGLREAGR
jgi:hypothetical protein